MDPSDEELIERANAGDRHAFDALYLRYRDWVTSQAYRLTGNRDDALDVLQDTFTYFFGKFPGFRLTASLKTFLYPAVQHLAFNRRRRHERVASPDFLASDAGDPRSSDDFDTSADLAKLVASLPEGQREVVILRFIDDRSLGQIAAALSLPLGTVKSRLHNALTALRERYRRS